MRALKLRTQGRFFWGGSLLLSGRVIHLDGDNLMCGTEFQWPTYPFADAVYELVGNLRAC